MIVSELTDQDRPAWDAYVAGSPHGLPFHLSGWKDVLFKTYRYETPYLLARDGDRIVGVMPLFVIRSFLVGSALTTLPGGLCADSEGAAVALIDEGRETARRLKVDRLVLHDTRQTWPGDLDTSSHHVAWIVDLSPGMDAVWKRANRDAHRQVRMGRNNDLTTRIDRTGDLVSDFHHVMSRFTHQAGTPIFGQDFVESVVKAFPGSFSILGVYKDKQPLGAYFSMHLRDTSFGIWGATQREYLPLRAGYLAYWQMLQEAVQTGCNTLDMGRSPAGSNASHFKGQWGGVSIPIYQQVASIGTRREAEAIAGRVRTDSRFQRFTRIWARLPYPVTQFLGPRLRRHVPFA